MVERWKFQNKKKGIWKVERREGEERDGGREGGKEGRIKGRRRKFTKR